jgi:hypothetical protein
MELLEEYSAARAGTQVCYHFFAMRAALAFGDDERARLSWEKARASGTSKLAGFEVYVNEMKERLKNAKNSP